jgi:dephospho-CoA kinase
MILGITGKSGSGKHTAAKYLEDRGWKILDADKISHNLYRPYRRAWRAIVKRFGEGILTKDDTVNRQKLRKIVFGKTPDEKKALKDLNAIIHPELKRFLKNEIHYQRRREKNVAVVASLWKELGLKTLCDKLLLVDAGQAIAYQRIHKRDGIDIEAYEAYTQNQTLPPDPDFVVKNEKGISDFYRELNKLDLNGNLNTVNE